MAHYIDHYIPLYVNIYVLVAMLRSYSIKKRFFEHFLFNRELYFIILKNLLNLAINVNNDLIFGSMFILMPLFNNKSLNATN